MMQFSHNVPGLLKEATYFCWNEANHFFLNQARTIQMQINSRTFLGSSYLHVLFHFVEV